MITEGVVAFVIEMLAFAGGSASVAFLLFRWLGKTWIENKFAQRLDQLRHQQALEIQRLRVEIDSMLSGALKLQEKEFSVLPQAWAKLHEAHTRVGGLVSPLKSYADVDRMTAAQLEEFVATTAFTASQKSQVINAQDKGRAYQDIVFWYQLHEAKKAFHDLHAFVEGNGIFLPAELEERFAKVAEVLWSAVVSTEVGREAKDWKLHREGWVKIRTEFQPLYKEIKVEIQARLQSHGRRT